LGCIRKELRTKKEIAACKINLIDLRVLG